MSRLLYHLSLSVYHTRTITCVVPLVRVAALFYFIFWYSIYQVSFFRVLPEIAFPRGTFEYNHARFMPNCWVTLPESSVNERVRDKQILADDK